MKIKRTLCMLLALMMVFSIAFPTTIFADDLFDEIVLEDEDYTAYEEPIEDVIGFDEEPYVEESFEDEIVEPTSDEAVIEDVIPEDIQPATEEPTIIVEDEVESKETEPKTTEAHFEVVEELNLSETSAFNTGEITIIKQPEDVAAALGQYATVTVEAEGENLSYLWYYKTVNDTEFKAGAQTTKTYRVKMGATQVDMQVFCRISNGTNSVDSNIVTLRLPTIVSEPFVFKKIDGTNNLALIEYTGNDSSITVPGSVDGMIVTEIGLSPLPEGEKGVFEDNTTLTSIKLPNTITAIREKSFKGCTNLSTMTTY